MNRDHLISHQSSHAKPNRKGHILFSLFCLHHHFPLIMTSSFVPLFGALVEVTRSPVLSRSLLVRFITLFLCFFSESDCIILGLRSVILVKKEYLNLTQPSFPKCTFNVYSISGASVKC